jgi:hypothetical protein
MRTAPALLCISMLFSTAGAAQAAGTASPADTYLAARDRMLANFRESATADKDQSSALSYLERLLRQAVPPWQAPGFRKGVITLASLTTGYADYGQLDGLRYVSTAGDTTVVVSTPLLLKRWLSDHRAWWPGRENVPQTVDAALHSEAFYTQAISPGAAMSSYGEVPLDPGTGVALLAVFAQDLAFESGPGSIVVSVIRGERVFVAQQKLNSGIKPIAVCQLAMKQVLAQADAEMNAYGASRLKDRASFDRHVELEENADREYRRCFARHLPEEPTFAAILKQAQTLVELLQ